MAEREQNNSTIFLVQNHDKSEQAILSMLSTPKMLSFSLVAEALIYHGRKFQLSVQFGCIHNLINNKCILQLTALWTVIIVPFTKFRDFASWSRKSRLGEIGQVFLSIKHYEIRINQIIY